MCKNFFIIDRDGPVSDLIENLILIVLLDLRLYSDSSYRFDLL